MPARVKITPIGKYKTARRIAAIIFLSSINVFVLFDELSIEEDMSHKKDLGGNDKKHLHRSSPVPTFIKMKWLSVKVNRMQMFFRT